MTRRKEGQYLEKMRNVTKNGRSSVPQLFQAIPKFPKDFRAFQVLIQTSTDAWLPSRGGGRIAVWLMASSSGCCCSDASLRTLQAFSFTRSVSCLRRPAPKHLWILRAFYFRTQLEDNECGVESQPERLRS